MPDEEVIAAALSSALGPEQAEVLLKRVENYSNKPNAVKGASKFPSDPETERVLVQVFDAHPEGILEELRGDPGAWALLALASRADLTLLDRLPAGVTAGDDPKIPMIRRAVARHAKSLEGPAPEKTSASTPGPELPASLPKVAAWLREHPDAAPGLFATFKGQKAAARRVAMRALGTIATPEALEVLAGYARADYPDAEIDELHRAWGRFDRHAFAAKMLVPNAWMLQLRDTPDLEGIGAADGLTGLGVRLTGPIDLTPLTECTVLERLRITVGAGSEVTGFEAVPGLPALRELEVDGFPRHLDLDPLAQSPVHRLKVSLDGADGSFLLRMPKLERLLLSGGSGPGDRRFADDDEPVALPAHPHLADVVMKLVSAGVRVVVYKHERSWVDDLVTVADAADGVFVVSDAGYIALTTDGESTEKIARHLRSNILP